ncbi:hypothetical protein BU24DRAFT_275279 [Aaosphaeria arxii CBS 175.79]|uniref:Pal1-domain-containing protein n=1 Tax=Aaosphaeria arxii CBS 175.79 TaxID=1450172 RepID=A0A6A5XGZ0_9PLEO|nr:uncharacterized protein BU24DRAFT_275279 [Aaosphaeria arxii CBS 175.79]KAF2012352.1 hypothetical protein BU24DRAFT_275279 [Aaosphaeria arxii CBS 175.79]
MGRVDSGFDESYSLKGLNMDRSSIHRSHTSPTSHSKTRSKSSKAVNHASNTSVDGRSRRPKSEKCPSEQPQTSPSSRRKSLASSSENSAKSRSRGYGSMPSSRRTSCTLVDPSRPSRHYRIKSTQSINPAGREVDDVLALHFRSYTMFQNPSYQTNQLAGTQTLNEDGSVVANHVPTYSIHNGTTRERQASPDDICTVASPDLTKQSGETFVTVQKADTMDWMSPTTRRREYEKIDKANSGFRGFVRRVLPRCVSGPPPPKFHDNDKSDAGSVRRYRLSLDDEEEEVSNEKHKATKGQGLEVPPKSKAQKQKKWGCLF